MSGGPVMLAWRDVDEAGESAADGYNVVVHEFAHVIDMRGGVTGGCRRRRPRQRTRALAATRWLDEYERFAGRVERRRGRPSRSVRGRGAGRILRGRAPRLLRRAARAAQAKSRALYRLLPEFFRQDPAR